jgi:hypothetical protein
VENFCILQLIDSTCNSLPENKIQCYVSLTDKRTSITHHGESLENNECVQIRLAFTIPIHTHPNDDFDSEKPDQVAFNEDLLKRRGAYTRVTRVIITRDAFQNDRPDVILTFNYITLLVQIQTG